MALLRALMPKNRNCSSSEGTNFIQFENSTVNAATPNHIRLTPGPHRVSIFGRRATTDATGSSVGRSTGSWPELQHRRPDSRRRRRARRKVSSLAHVYPQAPHHLSEQPYAEADSTKKPSLACPFFKLDPNTYQDCRRYELKRVKDVKQHLHRKHSNTSCCPRCSTAFDSAESLAEHHRSVQLCDLRDVPDVNRITEAQWGMLSQYHGRGKRIEDQWSDIYGPSSSRKSRHRSRSTSAPTPKSCSPDSAHSGLASGPRSSLLFLTMLLRPV